MMWKGRGRWFVFLAAALCASCSSKPAGPVRSFENGVEVVDNGAGIYAVPGQPSSLSLREELRIDLESEALAAAGLSDIVAIDADSIGRIYLFRSMRTQGPLVYQFDPGGKLIRSFGAMGQGPGEAQYPAFLGISPADEIRVKSQSPDRLLVFDGEGKLLRETRLTFDPLARPNLNKMLANGRSIARFVSFDERFVPTKNCLALYGPDFRKIKDLREYKLPRPDDTVVDVLAAFPIYGASASSFYVSWGDRGQDIALFDGEGRLKRILRAGFRSLPVPPEYRKKLLDRIPQGGAYQQTRDFLQGLREFPLFQAFLADENGRLFVVGWEKDPKTGANGCDVFSPDGVRILRAAVGFQDLILYMAESFPFDVVLKNGRAYCVREKPSGFKEVIVYAMIWR